MVRELVWLHFHSEKTLFLDSCWTERGSGNLFVDLQDEKLHGLRLLTSQVVGLLKKKMIYTLRKRKLLITQFLISPLLVIGAIYLSASTSNPGINSPPLTMSLSSYNQPQTLFFAENDVSSE